MKIIGHRGAAGLAPENTIASIKAAIRSGVDAIEFDVRATKDHELVLSHDASLERTHGVDKKVRHMSASEVRTVRSTIGHSVPTLTEAVSAAGSTPLYIEGKSGDWARPLAKFLHSHPARSRCTVISFNHQELHAFHQLEPKIRVLVLEHRNPFDAINAARVYDFDGIDINYWTLSPLSYWLARRHKLDIVVFTVNKPWIGSFLRILFPAIALTTNVPNKLQFLRPKRLRKSTNKTSAAL